MSVAEGTAAAEALYAQLLAIDGLSLVACGYGGAVIYVYLKRMPQKDVFAQIPRSFGRYRVEARVVGEIRPAKVEK